MTIKWLWKAFDKLELDELYAILALRNEVFIIEQNSVYNDTDGLDQQAWHLLGYDHKRKLVVYLRVLPPEVAYSKAASIGRLIVAWPKRYQGLSHKAVSKALHWVHTNYSNWPIKIAAQNYLQTFYKRYGFEVVSDPYIMDGLWHIDMVKPAD